MRRFWNKPALQTILRVGLGALFVYAGIAKFLTWDQFPKSIASFQIFPAPLVNLLAIGLPPTETVAGLLLILRPHSRAASLTVLILAFAFFLLITQAILRKLDFDCGCFGSGEHSHSSWIIFLRTFLILGWSCIVYGMLPQREMELSTK